MARDATRALTVFAEIADAPRLADRLAAFQKYLDDTDRHPETEPPATHFMRFVIIDDVLAWESNHDGGTELYLDAMLAKTPIADVFACCAGWPVDDREGQRAWLRQRSVRAAAFYTGYRGVSRAQLRNDRDVHDAIRDVIDSPERTALLGLSAPEIRRRLLARVQNRGLDTRTDNGDDLRWLAGKIAAVIVLLALAPLLLAILLPWYLVLRAKEKSDPAIDNQRPVHDDDGLAEDEDDIRQNQLTHVVEIKPGWFRYATLLVVLTAIDVVARVHSVHGHLGGIKSIHFARWVILRRRGRPPRLVFFSNYDGSWEAYLGEFIDRAAFGLTAVWSNTVGFPRTNHLLGDGAKDEEAFKNWTRCHQIETQVWWSSVPDSTVQNIRDDVWIRRQLDRGIADEEIATWLSKL